MNQRFASRVFLAAMLVFCLMSSAKEWISDDTSISLQIPDDPSWSQVKPPSPQVKLLLERMDRTAEAFFAVFPAPTNQQVLNQDFVAGFEKGYWPQGKSIKRTGEFSSFKGKRVYKTSGDMFIKDVVFKKAVIVWLENSKVFMISIMKRSADPYEDVVIQKFLATVKFTSKSAN